MAAKLIVGLPAHNEDKNIYKLLNNIHNIRKELRACLETMVVNDGSNDNTEKVLKKYRDSVDYMGYINHPNNLGLGAAMNTLLDYILVNYKDVDIFITMDADNTHNPKIMPSMIDMM